MNPINNKILSIGHVYKWICKNTGYKVELYLEHNCYHIRTFGTCFNRLSWDTFYTLKDTKNNLSLIKRKILQNAKRIS